MLYKQHFDDTSQSLIRELEQIIFSFSGILKHRLFSTLRAYAFSNKREDLITLGFPTEAPPFTKNPVPDIEFNPPPIKYIDYHSGDTGFIYYKKDFSDNSYFIDYLFFPSGDYVIVQGGPIFLQYGSFGPSQAIEDEFNVPGYSYYRVSGISLPQNLAIKYKNIAPAFAEDELVPIYNPYVVLFYSKIFKYFARNMVGEEPINGIIDFLNKLKFAMMEPSIDNIRELMYSAFFYDTSNDFTVFNSSYAPQYFYGILGEPGESNYQYGLYYTMPRNKMPFVVKETPDANSDYFYYVPVDMPISLTVYKVDFDFVNNILDYSDYSLPSITEGTVTRHSQIGNDTKTIFIKPAISLIRDSYIFAPPINLFWAIITIIRDILPAKVDLFVEYNIYY